MLSVQTLRGYGKALEDVGVWGWVLGGIYLRKRFLKSFDLFKDLCISDFSCDLIILRVLYIHIYIKARRT